jgi:uncharacterized protein (TIGR00266 family)
MKYNIFGENLPAVTISLKSGESVFTQSGGMIWMTNNIVMETNMKGGFFKGLGRMFSGESLFMVTYTAITDGAEITMASSFPGSIIAVDISNRNIVVQKNAFLCAQPSVELSMYINKNIGSGFFGGEGFILQKLSGHGLAFLEIDGTCCEKELAPGELIKVDTGNVAAFEETVKFEVERVKGFKNILFGGEGLFLSKLTGPGKVWLQTMTISNFAERIIPFLPETSNK